MGVYHRKLLRYNTGFNIVSCKKKPKSAAGYKCMQLPNELLATNHHHILITPDKYDHSNQPKEQELSRLEL